MGRSERTLPAATLGWLLVLAVGLGLTAAAGVVTSGDSTESSTADVLPAAFVGAAIALVLAVLAIGLLRRRPMVRSLGAPAVLTVVVACGALIGIATATGGSALIEADAETVDDGDPGEIGPTGTPARAAAPEPAGDRDRRDISDLQGSIVLAAGLLLLGMTTAFLMRRSELRDVERNAVYLRSDLLLEDDEPEPALDDTAIAEALARSLDELLNESDPRLAIRAAYGSLLNELAGIGVARHRYEGPAEHIRRCLSAHPLPTASINELLRLFEVARFSELDVTGADADRAREVLTDCIDALATVRS